MKQATSLKELQQIRAHNRSYRDSINDNLDTMLGLKKNTGEALELDFLH